MGGAASPNFRSHHGKAEPYRTVRRQSRSNAWSVLDPSSYLRTHFIDYTSGTSSRCKIIVPPDYPSTAHCLLIWKPYSIRRLFNSQAK